MTDHCAVDAHIKTEEIGREVVRQGGLVLTGATHGMPLWAAKGAKAEGGISIGISPAASHAAHVRSYRLPTEYMDFIIYTGSNYAGRNLLLTRAGDAVVITCGRMGTLNEFTVAFEDNKPVGVLVETGGMADEIEHIIGKAKRGPGKVIFDPDPKSLITRLIEMIDQERAKVDQGQFDDSFEKSGE